MVRQITGGAHCSIADLWMTGLFVEPVHNFVAPVADRSSDAEAVRSCAEVSPVAQRCFRDTDQGSDLLQRHQFIAGMGSSRCRGVGVVLMVVLLDLGRWAMNSVGSQTELEMSPLSFPRRRIQGGTLGEIFALPQVRATLP